MKPWRERSILWPFGISLAVLAVLLGSQLAYCSLAGCLIPRWLFPADRVVSGVVLLVLGFPILRKKIQDRKSKGSKAWWE